MKHMKEFEYLQEKERGILIFLLLLSLVGIIFILASVALGVDTFWGMTLNAVGVTFAAGAFISFFDAWRSASNALSDKRIKSILDAGIEQVEYHRDLEDYYPLMERARRVDVVGYSLRGFTQSHEATIKGHAKADEDFKMRIVLVDPKAEVSINRARLESNDPTATYENEVNQVIERFQGLQGVEIYLVDFSLGEMIFRIDDTLFFGPHFVKCASKATPTFRVCRGGRLYAELLSEFDELCRRGRTVA